MIICDFTVNIKESIYQEWQLWTTRVYMPRIVLTEMFLSTKMTEEIVEDKLGKICFSIPYFSKKKKILIEYQNNQAKEKNISINTMRNSLHFKQNL